MLFDLVDADTDFDLDIILVVVSKNGIGHNELEAAVRDGQAIGEVRGHYFEFRRLVVVVATAQVFVFVTGSKMREGKLAFRRP